MIKKVLRIMIFYQASPSNVVLDWLFMLLYQTMGFNKNCFTRKCLFFKSNFLEIQKKTKNCETSAEARHGWNSIFENFLSEWKCPLAIWVW